MNQVIKKIKVAHFVTDTDGGAGQATLNLHNSLKKAGITSHIFCRLKDNYKIDSNSVTEIENVEKKFMLFEMWRAFSVENLNKNSYSAFSYPIPSYFTAKIKEIVKDYDIIHLHWVSYFLSLEDIAYMSNQNKRIFITFHDYQLLSGGCHYHHNCTLWQSNCNNCPQLINTYHNFPRSVLETKKEIFNFKNISTIALSEHSKNIISKSIFKDCGISIIFNSIDLEHFNIFDSERITQLKKKYGVPLHKTVLLYSLPYISKVKGYEYLEDCLKKIDNQQDYHLILVGNENLSLPTTLSYTLTGLISHDTMPELYNMADITLIPSLEETFSLTAAESIATGTPIVGFDVGALPHFIENGKNGYIVETADVDALLEAIKKIEHKEQYSSHCRMFAEKHFSSSEQAKKHIELYQATFSQATSPQETINLFDTEEHPSLKQARNHILESNIYKFFMERRTLTIQKNTLEKNIYYKFGQLPLKKKILNFFPLLLKIIFKK